MASRDVELIIRAKDEATKNLDGITKSLKGFITEQKDAGTVAKASSTAADRFAKSIGSLDQTLRGLNSANKLARNFQAAQASLAGLEADAATTRQSLSELSTEFDRVGQAVSKNREEQARVTQTLEAQQVALDEQKTALRESEAALSRAAAVRKTLETAEKNLQKSIENSNQRLADAQARHAALTVAINESEGSTKRQEKSLDSASRRMAEYEERIQTLTAELATTRAAMDGFDSVTDDVTASLAQQSQAVAATEANLAGLAAEVQKYSKAARDAAKTQAALGKEQDRQKATLKSQEADLQRASEGLQEFAQRAQQSEQATKELAAALRSTLKGAFSAQQSTISQINNAFQENRQQIRELSTTIGMLGVPTKQQADALDKLRAAGAALETEFKTQKAVLSQLGAAYRDAGTDANEMAARTREATQTVAAGQAAFAAVATAATRAGEASARVVREVRASATAFERQSQEARDSAGSMDRLTESNKRAAESHRNVANASRSALSYAQRLRGEVMALITTYAGFQGALNVLKGAVEVQQTLEAATSRLNAVNRGNMQQTATDLDFIRRNADRLGIDMGTLVNEFTKFSAATNKTAIAGKATRDIFISVAEAGRVSKLSLDDMEGIFKAIIQIASKGKFQLEELSGQLGDRLPGALQILADGMGITVDQLLDMTKNGEVMASNLLNFADELDKRYGGQLAKSLESTTTAMGQLQNAAFQALAVFGNAGFIEGFTQLVRDMTSTLKDPAFLTAIQSVSSVLGTILRLTGSIIENFRLWVPVLSAIVGFKLNKVLSGIAIGFLAVSAESAKAGATAKAASAGIAAAGASAEAAATGVTALRVSLVRLLSSTGIGLAIAVIGGLIATWATTADDATEAMTRHRDIVDKVKNAYQEADGDINKWRKSVEGFSEALLRDERAKAQAALNASPLVQKVYLDWKIFDSDSKAQARALIAPLTDEFRKGQISLDQYGAALTDIGKRFPQQDVQEFIAEINRLAVKENEAIQRVKDWDNVIKAKTGSDKEATEILNTMTGATTDNADAANKAAESQKKFAESMDAIKALLPGVGEKMKENAKIAEGWAHILTAIANLDFSNLNFENLKNIYLGAQSLYNQQNELDYGDTAKALAGFTDGLQAASALIRQREGFIPYAKWDNNAYRTGFGSDTVTRNGQVSRVTQDTTVTMAEAVADLTRRTQEFMSTVVRQIGQERFSSFNPQQQAVLTSIAYNYGSLPNRILDAVRTGSKEEISAAIRGLENDNKGVNRGRRREEAYLFSNGEFDAKNADRIAESQAKAAEKAKEYHDNLKASNDQLTFENGLIDQGLIKREQAKAIYEAEQNAKKAGTELLAAEREQILANVEAKYREQAAQEELNKKKKEGEEVERRVNDLQTRRTELLNQMKLYQAMGDKEGLAKTKTELEQVNSELREAIDAAIKWHEAMGGPRADASIAKLRTMQLETQKVAQSANTAFLDWKRVGELFANGLVSAFDSFAQAVANGEKVGEAARDAFLKFAADFLIQIGKMILQQAIFNLLRGLGGPFAGLGLGGGGGVGVGLGHTGGVIGSRRVGAGNASRTVNPGVFANAGIFHSGGLPGLRPGEVPVIAKKNEEILSEDSPRNILNGGAAAHPGTSGGTSPERIKIVNMFDSEGVVAQGLSSPTGEAVLINFVTQNAPTINEILGRR